VRISQLPHACYVPAHLILLDLITLIIFDEAQKLRSSSVISHLQPPIISVLLKVNIKLSLCSF
jgi:hypothetical protein